MAKDLSEHGDRPVLGDNQRRAISDSSREEGCAACIGFLVLVNMNEIYLLLVIFPTFFWTEILIKLRSGQLQSA